MAWTNIPNANLAAGAPIRSVDLLAIRDNFAAMANQDAGAPPLVKSLNGQTGAITTNTFNSFSSTAGFRLGSFIAVGSTVPGSSLLKQDSIGSLVNAGASGTWRFMGQTESSGTGTYIRIS